VVNTNNLDKASKPYHPTTQWLHAGLVLGVIFQLICAVFMAHPHEHNKASAGHSESALAESTHVDHQLESPSAHSMHASSGSAETEELKHQDEAWKKSFMQAHRTGGVLVVIIIILNLLWAMILRGKPSKRQLSVLFSMFHWREALKIAKHVPMMMLGRRALAEPGNSLSLIVEMLGLLTMTAMAVTGFIVWNLWGGPGDTVSTLAELWMEVHGSLAVLLFLYLSGHVSMALLHMRSGDPVFARISPVTLKK